MNLGELKKHFSPKQLKVILKWIETMPEILLLDGAVGSGKTFILIWLFVMYVSQFQDQNKDFLITGQSVGAIERNIIKPIRNVWGTEVDTIVKGQSQKYLEWYGNRIWLFGTKNADSHESFVGMNAQGHLGNEITLHHFNSIQELLARVREPGSLFMWDTNPAGPNHHIYQSYISQAESDGNTKELMRFNFTLYDNSVEKGGFLPESYIKRLEKRYSGIWYKQKILGQWVAQEGQVYFPEKLNYYDDIDASSNFWHTFEGIYAWYDPASGGSSDQGCFDAIMVGGVKAGRIYLLDCTLDKIGPLKIKDTISSLFSRYEISQFGIESNFQQKAYVVNVLKQAFPAYPIIGVESRQNKLDRLVNMQTIIYDNVWFPMSWQNSENSGALLIRQLCSISVEGLESKPQYPEQFIDGPDALEGLIRVSSKRISKAGGTSQRVGGQTRKSMEF